MVGKKELINRIAEKGFTKKDAEAFINALSATVGEALIEGEAVKVGSLATFEAVDVAAREAKNPQTQEPVFVPAKKKVKVSVSETVKKLINE